jgi:hypothetical protein
MRLLGDLGIYPQITQITQRDKNQKPATENQKPPFTGSGV